MIDRRALLFAALISGAAHAGKLTDAQAKKAATDWIAAMQLKGDEPIKLDAAVALTATTMYAVAYDDDGAKCAETTATAPAAITKTLTCLRQHVAPSGKPKIWTRKSALHLSGPLLRHAKQIAALAKSATVVELDDGCDGMESWVVLAVTKDAKNVARVSAVLAQHMTCGE
ncbi:MAG: hypothetical protein JWO36_6648 [Myxococcales bacterium]|nr:hypothetical protein [Myxococcales bacterium]